MAVHSARLRARRWDPMSPQPQPGLVYERAVAAAMTTKQALAQLPAHEWTVLNDVHWPGSRYTHVDHLVVGPAGVFVIDSEAWTGTITVERGELRQNGRRRESVIAGAQQAARATELLLPMLEREHVNPVLCFLGTSEIVGRCGGVLTSSPFHLAHLLLTRPRVLTDRQRRAVLVALHAARPPAVRPRVATPSRSRAHHAPAAAQEAVQAPADFFAPRHRAMLGTLLSARQPAAVDSFERPRPTDATDAADATGTGEVRRAQSTWRAPPLLPESLLATIVAIYWTQPQLTLGLATWLIGLFTP